MDRMILPACYRVSDNSSLRCAQSVNVGSAMSNYGLFICCLRGAVSGADERQAVELFTLMIFDMSVDVSHC